MRNLKPYAGKRASKGDRQLAILVGLVEFYLETGRPVGSNTLKDAGFPDLSSATIRNYFAFLEEEGYLTQHHASGGRIPTGKAFRYYADKCIDLPCAPVFIPDSIEGVVCESSQISLYLQNMAEKLSELAKGAVYLSAPRFDQDYVVDMKLLSLDHSRCLVVLLTSFGNVHTETLHIEEKIGTISIRRLESYFRSRLSGQHEKDLFEGHEIAIGGRLYNEAMARYVVHYSHFEEDDVYRTGFSELLAYPEFKDALALANSLALFENVYALRALIKEVLRAGTLRFWVGDDLSPYLAGEANCAVVAVPYKIAHKCVGSIGVIGPMRMRYKELFAMVQKIARRISDCLTASLCKHKITYRMPLNHPIELDFRKQLLIGSDIRGDLSVKPEKER